MLGDPCCPQAQGDRCDRRSVRPLHPAWRSCSHPLRQRTGVRGQGRAGMDRGCRRQDRLHRAGQSLGERLHREFQRAPSRRAARRRNLLLAPRGPNCHRELAAPLQHDQAARLTWIQATSTAGVRARLRRVAGCATPSGSAGHAGETANFKLTFHLDHSAGADQPRVQAIWDFVHSHVLFGYQHARATRTAAEVALERCGVCRDFAHLAITLCRCMNIPARYCTGYLGDIGVLPDPNPMDFSAWFEVYLGNRWYTFDARHNTPRIGRLLMARGRDAADVAISTTFGPNTLKRFIVQTDEIIDEPVHSVLLDRKAA